MAPRQPRPTLVASRKNPAPGDSDSWGPHGPEAYERRMVVADAVTRIGGLDDFGPVEVFAAISPRGRAYMAERGYPQGFVDDEYATFVFLSGREEKPDKNRSFGDSAKQDDIDQISNARDDLVSELNEMWPVDGGWVHLPWAWGTYGNTLLISVAAPETRARFYQERGNHKPHPFGRHEKGWMRKWGPKQNPFVTDPQEAERRFWEVLADPDPASMEIALDILEEAGIDDDLDTISFRRADPEWVADVQEQPGHPYLGVFEFGIIGYAPQFDHEPGWWQRASERIKRLDDESYVIAEWIVSKTAHVDPERWSYEVYFWRQKEGWGDLRDSELYPTPEDARDRAVEVAWRIVQLLKSSPHMKNNRVAATVFRAPSQFQKPNPATGKSARPNPPEKHQEQVVTQFLERLQDPDPGSLIVAKDIAEQNGIPLSKISRWLGEPWSAWFSEAGGDAGAFPLLGKTGGGLNVGSSRDYKGVSWVVTPATQPALQAVRYDIEVLLWWNGAASTLENVFHTPAAPKSRVRQHGGGSRRFRTLETARTYAVQVAWAAITYLRQNWDQVQDTSGSKLVALLRAHNPIPLDVSVNPAHQGPRIDVNATSNIYYKGGYDRGRRDVRGWGISQDRDTASVAVDALLSGQTQSGLSMLGPEFWDSYTTNVERERNRPDWTDTWSAAEKKRLHHQATQKLRDAETWGRGYVDAILDAAERVAGLREGEIPDFGGMISWTRMDDLAAMRRFRGNPPPGNSAPEDLEPAGIRVIDYDDDGDERGSSTWYPQDGGGDAASEAADLLLAVGARFGHDLNEYSEHEDYDRLYVLFGFTDEELLRIRRKVVPGVAEEEDREFEDNPCECEMTDQPKQNPAWVTKHLADSWVTLEQKVPTKWLPKLDRTTSKGKRLVAEIPEYGCGAYGCVMPTNDPQIVLKLTTDDTEAQFAARLANQLPVPIVTKYELVMQLPTAKRQGRDVYLLWREAAEKVGEVDKVVGEHAEIAIDKQHKAAQAAFDKLARGEKAERELAAWQVALQGMAKIKALSWLANGMLAAFQQRGIFFGDIHGGNLGQARGQWVITDPGHVAVVGTGEASARPRT